MIDFLYNITIAPLEFLMEIILQFAYVKTNSYGIALIILSISINTVLLPIYNKTDSWQDEERNLKKSIVNREKMIKRTFIGQERFAMLSELYRQVGYSPILSLKASLGIILQIPFFFAAYQLLSHTTLLEGHPFIFLNNLGKPDELLSISGYTINILPLFMTIINLFSTFIYSKNLTYRDKLQLYSMAGLFLVLLYNSSSALTFYWTINNIYSLLKNIIEKEFFPYLKNIDYREKIKKILKYIYPYYKSYDSIYYLFWPSYLFCVSIVCIYFPINLYLSDPSFFNLSPLSLIFYQYQHSIVAILLAFFIILSFSSKKIKFLISLCTVIIGINFLIFGFILTKDYGVLDNFTIQKTDILNPKQYILSDILCIIMVYFVVSILYIKNKLHVLKVVFIVGCFLLNIVSIYNFFISEKVILLNQQIETNRISSNEIPKDIKELCSFSKDKENIVVIMLDMFTGGHMKEIIERNSEIKEQLDGFIWYPDTVASGDSTVFGKPCLLGGEKATPLFINKDTSKSIEEKVNDAWGNFLGKLDEQEFKISILEHEFLRQDIISKYFKNKQNLIRRNILWGKCVDYWINKIKFTSDISLKQNSKFFLTVYGLFKASPRIFRDAIYKNATWCKTVNSEKSFGSRESLIRFSNLDALHLISNINSNQKTFRFIINELTHNPWYINSDGYPCNVGGGYSSKQRNKSTGIFEYHYLAELGALKSLIRWFQWMKDNGVYDNTQIIIVSDHCRKDSSQLLKMWSEKGKYDLKSLYPINLHSLLLVKEINSRGLIKIDYNSLMATWDIPIIVNNALNINQKEYPWKDSNRERISVLGEWQRERHQNNIYNLKTIIKVKGSVFKKSNWITIK